MYCLWALDSTALTLMGLVRIPTSRYGALNEKRCFILTRGLHPCLGFLVVWFDLPGCEFRVTVEEWRVDMAECLGQLF